MERDTNPSHSHPHRNRVLSIQSHVVSGYVGNKAAVFPLQLLGLDVDVINSVHFSNHTGYPQGVQGNILQGDELLRVFSGLQENNLLTEIGHVLTGYMGSESFLESVLHLVETLRSLPENITRPIRYVCDPVLGDAGQFYVPPELVKVYQQRVIPLADVLTPNQFEAEQLTGIPIQTLYDARMACLALHDMGPRLVVITSLLLMEHEQSSCDTISILASRKQVHQEPPQDNTRNSATNSKSCNDIKLWRITCPMIDGLYTGTGDLCSALLLAHTATMSEDDDNSLPRALEQVVNTMYAVIERTRLHSQTFEDPTSAVARELRLIQSKHDIERPPPRFKAFPVDSE